MNAPSRRGVALFTLGLMLVGVLAATSNVVRTAPQGAQTSGTLTLACSLQGYYTRAPAIPIFLDVIFRIQLERGVVEMLNSDNGAVIRTDSHAAITARSIKWGRGYLGLNTWDRATPTEMLTDFDGTINRESGTISMNYGGTRVENGSEIERRGTCQPWVPKTPKF
jgi:hypothetical protein